MFGEDTAGYVPAFDYMAQVINAAWFALGCVFIALLAMKKSPVYGAMNWVRRLRERSMSKAKRRESLHRDLEDAFVKIIEDRVASNMMRVTEATRIYRALDRGLGLKGLRPRWKPQRPDPDTLKEKILQRLPLHNGKTTEQIKAQLPDRRTPKQRLDDFKAGLKAKAGRKAVELKV